MSSGPENLIPINQSPSPETIGRIATGSWLPDPLSNRFQTLFLRFSNRIQPSPRPLIIAEANPVGFLAAFFAALKAGRTVVSASLTWGELEWNQVLRLTGGERFLLNFKDQTASITENSSSPHKSGDILIPTGGTTGTIRFARHSWKSLSAAATSFSSHFTVDSINSISVLPLYHVSGLMQAIRAIVSGGKFIPTDWRNLENGIIPESPGSFFLSLVPTQLHRLLSLPKLLPWLRSAQAILIGGAAAPPPLLAEAARLCLPISLSYGSTETAAMVTAQKPTDFASGDRSSGTPLPHVKIRILDENGHPLKQGQKGIIAISATSLFHGYLPKSGCETGEWISGDIGLIDHNGALHLFGRADSIINTGGEKVLPAEVEKLLSSSPLLSDAFIFGLPDPEWGEVVAAAYSTPNPVSPSDLHRFLQGKLAPHKIPKKWFPIQKIPRTSHGKIDRQSLEKLLGFALPKKIRSDK